LDEYTLYENTKVAAYFLWEHTGCDNALHMWICAEDLACFFEQTDILDERRISGIARLSRLDPGYVQCVRHIAFRIYVYSNNQNEWDNWFAAERLLANAEWARALTGMANIYRKEGTNHLVMGRVRSENVRAYYDEQTLHSS
jgi:hypothetical protein